MNDELEAALQDLAVKKAEHARITELRDDVTSRLQSAADALFEARLRVDRIVGELTSA